MTQLLDILAQQAAAQGLSMALTLAAVIHLNAKIKECEADRKALWERLLQQQNDETDA
jgi:predicted kinase